MRRPLVIEKTFLGPRVYVLGLRIHHGLAGAVAFYFGIRAMWSDRADFPWLRDNRPLQGPR